MYLNSLFILQCMVQDDGNAKQRATLNEDETLENMNTLTQTFMEVFARHLKPVIKQIIIKHCFGCTVGATGQMDHECLTFTCAESLDLYYDYSIIIMNRDAMLFDFLSRVERDCIFLIPSFKMKNALESFNDDELWRNKIKQILLK